MAAAVLGATLLAHPGAAQSGHEVAQPYIIVLHDSVTAPWDVARQHAGEHRAQVMTTYGTALTGCVARHTERARAAVARDARVAYVEPDGVTQAATVQTPATWRLDRIRPAGAPARRCLRQHGDSCTAYVIDSGMRLTHAGSPAG